MRRVHVAGTGAVTPFGPGASALLDAIFRGESAVRERDRLADVDCLTRVAAELPGEWADPARAAAAALDEAGAADALIVASTKADLSGVVGEGDGLGSPYRLARRLAPDVPDDRLAAVSCACVSGLSGLALGARWIKSGHCDSVTVVGVDILNAFIVQGFSSLLALDEGPCRPYDRNREGLNLGEAAAAIRLSVDPSDVELAGWGESNDANHITGPRRDGSRLHAAAHRALLCAELRPDDVDYVHTHGTGTPFNDAMEGAALLALFDNAGPTPPVSGTKAQTGHMLGAAGVVESLIAIEALRRKVAPANRRLGETDVDERVTLVREPATLRRAEVALKFAAGFGGINAALVFTR
ncbi:MAG: beta-ketoacyl synthase N-terminal-like domain-containing protein [Planctomycetota bacterium]|jgi:3-oxoacyl-(acyl-carrier-protein) synthase